MTKLINNLTAEFDNENKSWEKLEQARKVHSDVMEKYYNHQATNEEAINASKNLEEALTEWQQNLLPIMAQRQ